MRMMAAWLKDDESEAPHNTTVYHVTPSNMATHHLPSVLVYSNSIGLPREQATSILASRNATTLLSATPVFASTFDRLMRAAAVGSIGLLSVSLDAFVLSGQYRGALASIRNALRRRHVSWPAVISFDDKWVLRDASSRNFSKLIRYHCYVGFGERFFVRSVRVAPEMEGRTHSLAGSTTYSPACFAEPRRQHENRVPGCDLDFMEVGTSDFDTLSGAAPHDATGMAVEMMPYYLARIPNRRGVRKVNAALVGDSTATSSAVQVWYVDQRDIQAYKLPYWLKGCNQVGSPSRDAWNELKRRQLGHLMRNVSVPTRTFRSLVEGVCSIGLLKLDVEGQEAAVLSSMLEVCAAKPSLCPRAIAFETTHMRAWTKANLHANLTRGGYMWAVPKMQRDRLYVRRGLGTRLDERAAASMPAQALR